METAEFEASHAIWKRLPLHPLPEPFESMTSYLIRLAEANGLRSLRQMVALLGIPRRRLENVCISPDYPTSSHYGGLAQITGYPEERFLPLTFHFLIQRFGYSLHPTALHRFLKSSLASSLRYCPACLATSDPPYYSLLWRFLVLPGCIEHRGYFLDQCGHCGSFLPLLPLTPQLAKCPRCQGDLRMCQQKSLSEEVLLSTYRHTQDLKKLLSPVQSPLPEVRAKIVGKHCMALRQCQDLSITELARLSGQDLSVILAIEQVDHFAKASLSDYIQYADALSLSLTEILDADRLRAFLIPPSEEV